MENQSPNQPAMTSATLSTIEINGTRYVPEGSGQTLPTGTRNVVVIDRGWIFAGDTTFDETTQEFLLTNALWVFKWESVGFDGVIKDPKSSKVTIRKMDQPVVVPKNSVIFKVPVDVNWGL
jgi:hypothetical protein